jgi:predicted transposase/invertase (TIGR01784 family)
MNYKYRLGKEEGLQAGLTEGSRQEKLEIARNFKTLGLSAEQIAAGTGLSPAEIEKL